MEEKVHSFFESVRGKRVTFCGIGGSNLPLIRLFLQKGAIVSACDKRGKEMLPQADELLSLGVTLHLGEDYLSYLTGEDIIFRTPGMRYYTPELTAARKRGAAVTSEMEVFFDLCPCKIYAVTGSDGKTTTTTILSEMLKAAGKTVHLGGNIGKPLLPEIESVSPDDVAVVELSSFQLISMRKSPDVAVVTNLSPNHLDLHADMEEYISAKKNIFLHQNAFGICVLNADNEITRKFASETRGKTRLFSRKDTCAQGAFLRGDSIIMNPGEQVLFSVGEIRIPGLHNVENYLAAISAAWGDVPPEIMRQVARDFPGVEHRNEFVRELEGVSYYNDSIGTSPTRTIRGTLSLYDKKMILIAGGYDKKIPFEPLGAPVVEKVKTLILMGATAGKIEKAVREAEGFREGCPQILHADNMEDAVQKARAAAVPGDIVTLSPACASFDLYPNFEARGNHFKEVVQKL